MCSDDSQSGPIVDQIAEKRARAEKYLTRSEEIMKGATKTAAAAFVAVALLWFTQIQPGYQKLLHEHYIAYFNSYASRANLGTRLGQAKGANQYQTQIAELQKSFNEQQAILNTAAEPFKLPIFGLDVTIPPLYGALVCDAVLLGLILYLAQARRAVWMLCARALRPLMDVGDDLDGVLISGPIWLVPPPYRYKKNGSNESDYLHKVFVWGQMQMLPNVYMALGLLLILLLAVYITTQGLVIVHAASVFTKLAGSIPNTNNLTLSPIEASLITACFLLIIVGLLVCVSWWLRSSSIVGHLTGEADSLRGTALLALITILIVSCSGIIFADFPTWGAKFGKTVYFVLPPFTAILTGLTLGFCVRELVLIVARGVTPLALSESDKADTQSEVQETHETLQNSSDRTEVEEDKAERHLLHLLWSRRDFISRFAIPLLGGALSLSYFRSKHLHPKIEAKVETSKKHDRPHFRVVKEPARALNSDLEEGFYIYLKPVAGKAFNQKKHHVTTVYYINKDKWVLFAAGLAKDLLQPLKIASKTFNNLSKTRVRLAYASASFELAAIERLRKADYPGACQLLIAGIQHDLYYKRMTGGKPSIRLYDLLALVTKRYEQDDSFKELMQLAQVGHELIEHHYYNGPDHGRAVHNRTGSHGIRRLVVPKADDYDAIMRLESNQFNMKPAIPEVEQQRRPNEIKQRIVSWQNPDSNWHKKATNKGKPINWQAIIPKLPPPPIHQKEGRSQAVNIIL